jgi:three-Cys-motif partner protein
LAVVGPWAKEKLEALGRYLDFYTKVMKNQPWRTIYIDAFAGGGRAVVRAGSTTGPNERLLFLDESEVDAEQRELIDGSPRIALDVDYPFSRYVFIEPDRARGDELEAMKKEYGLSRRIDILHMDAAAGIEWVISQSISKRSHRGIAFLDPFGARLNWSSIRALADTGLFEVVINFGLNMAIQRMLPNSGEIPEAWAKTLDAYFGSRRWFAEVYGERSSLFANSGFEKRDDYIDRLLKLYCSNLEEAFGNVAAPRLIRNTRGAPLYYLLWAGPHPKGQEGANYILKMGQRLGRRRGGHTSK